MIKAASYILAIITVMTVAATAFAQSAKPKNEIAIFATVAVPSGEANFSGTNDAGSNLDFNRDFQFGNKWGFQIRYAYRSENGKHKFVADYANTNWDRTRIINHTFTFAGQTYTANGSVEGNLKQSTWRGMYAYRWGNDKVRIGPMIDMGVFPTHLNITGTTASGTRQAEGTISTFAATVGYDLDYDPTDKISIFNNLGGIVFHNDHLFHAEGGLKYYASHHFGVVGGYSFQRFRWAKDNNSLRLSAHGPFVGGVIRF